MALAIDASTPAARGSTAIVTSLASNSFSPPGNALLLVMFANADLAGGVTAITDSLATHLTYTKKVSEIANACAAEIWIADVPATAPGAMTVTVSFASARDISIDVAVITGAKPAASQTGATQVNTGTTGVPSATIASLVAANSLIVGRVANFTNATGPTIPAGQSDVFNGLTFLFTDATNGSANWAQYLTGMNLAAGASATINDTAPSVQHSMCVAEILAAASGSSFTASTADTSATTDAVTRTLALPRSGADTSATGDAVTRTVAFHRAGADATITGDAVSRALALGRATGDTSASTDTLTRVVALARAGADTSATGDAVSARRGTGRTLADSSSTGDAVTRSAQAFTRSGADTSATGDAVSRVLGLPRAVTDSSTGADAVTRLARFARPVTDTSLTADSATHGAVPQPPRITPPTAASITAYGSRATVLTYTSAAVVFEPAASADIPTTFSAAALIAYHSAAAIAAYVARAGVAGYSSSARIGPTLG